MDALPPAKRPHMDSLDTWATLLPDLLLEVFRRLAASAVIYCASACKPWRRTIISNASSLQPRPDRFNPNLLLGFFHNQYYQDAWLQRVPGPFQSALPPTSTRYRYEAAHDFIPAAAAAASDAGDIHQASSYGEVLSSRDGFVLFIDKNRRAEGLCLCNPMTGECTFLAAAAVKNCKYVLVTGGYDLSPRDDATVRILAMAETGTVRTWKERMITYQLFSFASSSDGAGAWGPVKSSWKLDKPLIKSYMVNSNSIMVCRDAVHWLAGTWTGHGYRVTCAVGLDVCNGRAWTTELPEQCHFNYHGGPGSSILATTGDGRLSLIRSMPDHRIYVWVLIGAEQWSLQRRISVPNQMVHSPHSMEFTSLSAFCPRSGFVVGELSRQELRIDIESHSDPLVERTGEKYGYRYSPYEMDWSTYLSKLKHF
ncbi:unnamed protein product [Urochloa humidicola]